MTEDRSGNRSTMPLYFLPLPIKAMIDQWEQQTNRCGDLRKRAKQSLDDAAKVEQRINKQTSKQMSLQLYVCTSIRFTVPFFNFFCFFVWSERTASSSCLSARLSHSLLPFRCMPFLLLLSTSLPASHCLYLPVCFCFSAGLHVYKYTYIYT